jgi:hypothetical protein
LREDRTDTSGHFPQAEVSHGLPVERELAIRRFHGIS